MDTPNIIKICGIAFCTLAFVFVARSDGQKNTVPISAVAGMIILGIVLVQLYAIIDFIVKISATTAYAPYVKVLIKTLGIALICETTSQICRDAGENSLADKVEFAGKVEIMFLCMPLIKGILEIAEEVLKF